MLVGPRLDGPAWAMLVVLSLLWGSSFIFIEVALEGLPVLTLVGSRVVLATITLWAAVALLKVPVSHTWAIWGAFAVMGLTNNAIPFSLIAWGQMEITAGLAAVLNATTPLFTGLLAGIFLSDERLTGEKLTGLLLGLVGVAVMMGLRSLSSLGTDLAHQCAVLGAALSYGVSVVFGRRFARFGVRPIVIAAGQTTMSSLYLVPMAFLVDGAPDLAALGTTVITATLALAIVSTGLAYVLYFAILSRAGATNATLVTVLAPVVAIGFGVLLLGEAVSAGQFVGLGLIAAGLAVLDGRLWRLRHKGDAAPR